MAAVPVVVCADFTCPFSYVTETALRRMEAAGEVSLQYLAFELYPHPEPLPGLDPQSLDPVRPLAAELGLPLGEPVDAVRSRKAHEAATFARGRGVEGPLRDAIFRAYFEAGRDIGRIDVLVELGAGVGLDASELKVVLDVDALAAQVEAEEEAARSAGITAVPAIAVGSGAGAKVLIGAQPLAELRREILGG